MHKNDTGTKTGVRRSAAQTSPAPKHVGSNELSQQQQQPLAATDPAHGSPAKDLSGQPPHQGGPETPIGGPHCHRYYSRKCPTINSSVSKCRDWPKDKPQKKERNGENEAAKKVPLARSLCVATEAAPDAPATIRLRGGGTRPRALMDKSVRKRRRLRPTRRPFPLAGTRAAHNCAFPRGAGGGHDPSSMLCTALQTLKRSEPRSAKLLRLASPTSTETPLRYDPRRTSTGQGQNNLPIAQ